MRFQAPGGTRDILSPQVEAFVRLESLARAKARLWGFREIRPPTFEDAALYGASVGAATDIVEKEMFSFEDRGGRRLALRPEGTAGVVRAYLENSLDKQESKTQLFYIGNMFRGERPQAGRYREFEQVGFEILGDPSAMADAELIVLALSIIKETGAQQTELLLNSIGCQKCRPPYRQALQQALKPLSSELCENCLRRMEKNPLRVLDCKQCSSKLSGKVPILEQCEECKMHDSAVKSFLETQKIAYRNEPRLVRGLDYYCRTVFEVTAGNLGSQSAVCGGGRYDGLVELLGGQPTPATGFAIGVDRLLQAAGEPSQEGSSTAATAALVFASKDTLAQAFGWRAAQILREKGITVVIGNPTASMKSQMRQANKAQASYCIIVGDDEFKENRYTLKNLKDGSQKKVSTENLVKSLHL